MQIPSQNTSHTLFTENTIFQKVKSISELVQNNSKTWRIYFWTLNTKSGRTPFSVNPKDISNQRCNIIAKAFGSIKYFQLGKPLQMI